jgi:hypothetical protein
MNLESRAIFLREYVQLFVYTCPLKPVSVDLLRSPGFDSQPGGIDSSKTIPGLHKRLQIRYLKSEYTEEGARVFTDGRMNVVGEKSRKLHEKISQDQKMRVQYAYN